MKNIWGLSLLFVCVSVMQGAAQETSALTAQTTPTANPKPNYSGPCHGDSKLVGKCYTFRGRGGYLNGNIRTFKIMMLGTHRILGVTDADKLPDEVLTILRDDLGAEIFGTFTVCPHTRYKKGTMQYVCVDSVKITKIVKSGK